MPIVTMMLSAAASVSADPAIAEEAQTACSASTEQPTTVAGIAVRHINAEPGDLEIYRITDIDSGDWMDAFYDKPSQKAARSRTFCLGAQLKLLRRTLADDRVKVRWAAAVFTTDPNYVIPKSSSLVRWVVPVRSDGKLTIKGQEIVVSVLPHEQAHVYQLRNNSILPRWFMEGHAEWIGELITEIIAPKAAVTRRKSLDNDLKASTTPVALSKWGSIKVKSEAVLRQLPAAERAKFAADPTYKPSTEGVSFSFGPDDMESDESNTEARYAASWHIFNAMEVKRGQHAVQLWVSALTARPGRVDAKTINMTAKVALGENLEQKLS